MKEYNIKGGLPYTFPDRTHKYLFRGQNYAPGDGEDVHDPALSRQPIRFSYAPHENRFTPRKTKTAYFGLHPLSVVVETIADFRLRAMPQKRNLMFSEDELKRKELFKIEIQKELKLFSLDDQYASARHRLKRDAEEICGKDLGPSSEFATQVLSAGYDGIIYPTRQGINQALVVFETAKDKLDGYQIISRESYLTTLKQMPNAEATLGIKIIEDN
jgi:hypothetical protein